MFYLGGLGSIHGYRHKEFIGTEYVQVSGEYSFRIPHSEIAPFLMYDGGKMMGDRLIGDDCWYSSIGVGVDIDRSFRLFMAKRLDIGEQDPVFYARFSAAVF
jgi:hemolysin activation/secretion protein